MCGEQTKKVVANNNIQMRAGFGHDAKIFRFYNAAVNRRHRRRRSLQRAIILCAQRAAICTPPPVPQYSHKLARHRVYYTRGHRFRLEIGTENVYKKKQKQIKRVKFHPSLASFPARLSRPNRHSINGSCSFAVFLFFFRVTN